MTGFELLRLHTRATGAALLGVAATLAVAGALAHYDVRTVGAMGPRFATFGAMGPFSVHIVCGLVLPFAFFTQVSGLVQRRRPELWVAGAVAYALLGFVSTLTGWMLAGYTAPQLAFALRLSVGVLLFTQLAALRMFVRGDWVRYRLWVVRSSLGLLLQLTNRLSMATLFVATGDEPFASTAGFWTAMVLALLILEWVVVPFATAPERAAADPPQVPGAQPVVEPS